MPWPTDGRPRIMPTRYDVLARRYAHCQISLDVYEQALGVLRDTNTGHEPSEEPMHAIIMRPTHE